VILHSKTLKTKNQAHIPLPRGLANGFTPGPCSRPGVNPLAKLPPGSVLSEYITLAQEIFKVEKERGVSGPDQRVSYGFIYTTDNCPQRIYGYKSLYHKISGHINFDRINTIKELKGGRKRLYIYDLGLLEEKEVYHWFNELVFTQNNSPFPLKSETSGEIIFLFQGRFCNRKGKRSAHIQNIFKQGIGEISDCILLTLTTHEKEVISFMPDNTNLLPVQFATVNIGRWVSRFVKSLRQYQVRNGIPWSFVGWTLEFQENGYPHGHLIFKGKWIGDIKAIAALWRYSEPQGVDYMNKAKYEQELRDKGKLLLGKHVSGIRLINYITAYVSKCSKAVNQEGVHKGYAWLAFSGGRLFNVAREYKKQRAVNSGVSDWVPFGKMVVEKF